MIATQMKKKAVISKLISPNLFHDHLCDFFVHTWGTSGLLQGLIQAAGHQYQKSGIVIELN